MLPFVLGRAALTAGGAAADQSRCRVFSDREWRSCGCQQQRQGTSGFRRIRGVLHRVAYGSMVQEVVARGISRPMHEQPLGLLHLMAVFLLPLHCLPDRAPLCRRHATSVSLTCSAPSSAAVFPSCTHVAAAWRTCPLYKQQTQCQSRSSTPVAWHWPAQRVLHHAASCSLLLCLAPATGCSCGQLWHPRRHWWHGEMHQLCP